MKYHLIEHFDIVWQQEVNWIYNESRKLNSMLHVEKLPEMDIFGQWNYTAKMYAVNAKCLL